MTKWPAGSVSVVIVLWNSRSTLKECLVSVCRELECMGPRKTELLVVDNASTDDSVRVATELVPSARVVSSPANIGFGSAANLGLARVRGDLVLILNPDAFLRPRSLSRMIELLESDPLLGLVGPLLVDEDRMPENSCFPEPTWLSELWALFHLDRLYPVSRYRTIPTQPRRVDVVQGACLLARAPMLRELRGFDEQFFMYSEEWDLCLRARRAGWRVGWEPRAEVRHLGAVSTSQIAAGMFQQLYRSKVLFFRKHGGRWRALTYKLGLCVAALCRLCLAPVGLFASPRRRLRYWNLSGRYFELIKRLPHY